MKRKLLTALICCFVAFVLVSCGTVQNIKDTEADPVLHITEEVADESLPLPTGEAEKTADVKEAEQTEPAKIEKTQEKHETDDTKEAEQTESTKVEKMQEKHETDEMHTTEECSPSEEPARMEKNILTCTLSVRCDTVFDNIHKLHKEKQAILPQNGIIFPKTNVVFYAGESVFNVLTRELKKNKIHVDFVNTPMYNTVYIKGISNLYEQDCGELSGWVYMVNGKVPSYGCSQYMLKDGDDIAFVYTCDLGKDVH